MCQNCEEISFQHLVCNEYSVLIMLEPNFHTFLLHCYLTKNPGVRRTMNLMDISNQNNKNIPSPVQLSKDAIQRCLIKHRLFI